MSLPIETVEDIQDLAAERGVTYSETIRQAIEDEKFLRKERARDNKVLLKSPDGSISRVIFR